MPGSRRSLDHCRNWHERRAIEGEMRRQIGEDCEIMDSAVDRPR